MIEIKEEKECIQKLRQEKDPAVRDNLLAELLKIKIKILCNVKTNTKNHHVSEICNDTLNGKIKSLTDRRDRFSILYNYLKDKQSTDEIQDILTSIEMEMEDIKKLL